MVSRYRDAALQTERLVAGLTRSWRRTWWLARPQHMVEMHERRRLPQAPRTRVPSIQRLDGPSDYEE